jgi:hypothetical protein
MFKQLLIGLVLVFGLSGCITMPDGQSTPDYEMIEFSAVAGMSVIVGETKTTDETKLLTYERLVTLKATLECTGEDCPPFNLVVLESMIQGALPIEYQALGVQGIRLIKSRAEMYLDPKLPDIENIETIRKISISVVGGMILALEPYITQIKGE